MKNIFRQNKKNFLIVILIIAGGVSVGITYATSGAGPYSWLSLVNGGSLFWGDNGTSIAETNSTGNGTGSYLNVRGWSGIVFRDQGSSGQFGKGTEIARINPTGIVMASGTSYSWSDLGTSLSRNTVSGGADLVERGFSGIDLQVNGTTGYGTGVEVAKITLNGNVGIGTTSPAQKLDVSGNVRLSGSGTSKIVSPNNICIGAC
ncbi:MAG: hypothetical protein WBF38_06845 [Nitrosotalea sp.]